MVHGLSILAALSTTVRPLAVTVPPPPDRVSEESAPAGHGSPAASVIALAVAILVLRGRTPAAVATESQKAFGSVLPVLALTRATPR
jgi:hypothetical protein